MPPSLYGLAFCFDISRLVDLRAFKDEDIWFYHMLTVNPIAVTDLAMITSDLYLNP